jgi:hypothetical protein
MSIKHRLISNGILITTTEFNEVDKPTIEIARDGIYAEEIDEVSFTPVPMRFARDKRILVIPGYFDEVTGILVSSTPQSVFVFPSTSIMGEGRYMSFAVSNLPEDETYYWTILNNTTSDLDFSTTSGTFQTFNGVGSFQIRAALDKFTDGATELFRVEIRENSITGPVIGSSELVSVFDNSTTEFGVFTESLEIEEDVTITFRANSLLTTSTLYWTINHGSTSPTDFVANSGSFATTQGSGTFTVRLIRDFLTEGPETFSVQVRTGSTSGPIIATSVALVAIDTSQSVNFDGNALTVIEGQQYTATFGNRTDVEVFWFSTLGNTGSDYATAVAVDVDDNLYISGYTPNSSGNLLDSIVTKLTYTGGTVWQRQLGSASVEDTANDIAITGLGDLAIIGTIDDDSLGEVLQVINIDASGTVLWGNRMLFSSTGTSIDYNSSYFYATGTETVSGVKYITVLRMFRTTGRIDWIRRIGSPSQNIVANGISVTPTNGRVIVVGTVSNLSNTTHSLYVVCLDLAGNLLWQKQFSNLSNSYGNNADATDNDLYVIGTTEPAAGQKYLFLIKFNLTGTVIWTKILGGTNQDEGNSVTIHPSSDVLVTGKTSEDLLVARITSSGNLVWQNKVTGLGIEQGKDINLNAEGNFHLAGTVYEQNTGYKMFIAKLPSDGTLTGTYENILYSPLNLVLTNGTLTETSSTYSILNPGTGNISNFYFVGGNISAVDLNNNVMYITSGSGVSKINLNSLTETTPASWAFVFTSIDGRSNIPLTDIVLDDQGYVYLAARFYLDFQIEYASSYVFKIDPSNGNVIWAKYATSDTVSEFTNGIHSVSASPSDFRTLIKIDYLGNLCLLTEAGYFLKISRSDGALLSKIYVGEFGSRPTEFTFDSAGNTYFVGYRTYGSFFSDNSGWLLKLDSSNNISLRKRIRINTFTDTKASNCVLDSNLNIYVILLLGEDRGGIGALIKFNPSGVVQWAKRMPTTTVNATHGMAVDSLNNIYFSFRNLLAKVSSSGSTVWALTTSREFSKIQIDEINRKLYLIGPTVAVVSLDGIPLGGNSFTAYASTTTFTDQSTVIADETEIGVIISSVQTLTMSYNRTDVVSNSTVEQLYKNPYVSTSGTLIKNIITINPVTGFIPNGTYYWTINHVTTTSADFVTNSGTLNVTNGATTVTVTTIQDYIQEGFRGFKIQLRTGSTSGTVVFETPTIFIDDSDFIPSIVPNVTAINEGSSVTFTLSNIGPTGTYYWTSSSSDLTAANGTVSITNGAGTLTVTATGDLVTEGPETFAVSIRNGSITGPIIITSEEITINDTSINVILEVQTPSIIEGQNAILAVTNIFPNGTYYWTILHETTVANDFSATSGSFTSVANIASISITSVNDYISEGARTFRVQIRTGSTSGPVVSLSDSITIDDATIVPTLTHSSQVNEGSSITVSCSNIGPNGTYYWTTENTEDLTTTSGTVFISNGAGSFSITARSDFITEGNETFTVSLRSGSRVGPIIVTSDIITIVDTSQSPTITFSANPINEGQVLTVFLSNVFPLTATLYWTLYPVTAERNEINVSSGSIAVTNGGGSFTLSALNDFLTEGPEIFKIRLRTGSVTGPIIATSDEITITDTSTTPIIELSSTAITELELLTATVTAPNGTYYWTIRSLTTNTQDFAVTNSAFTVVDGTGTFSITPVSDYLTEGTESFVIDIRISSVSGTIIATSEEVAILDTSINPVLSLSSLTVEESSILQVTVETLNGTYYWTVLNETTSNTDFTAVNGSFIVSEGIGTFGVPVFNEYNIFENTETFKVQIRIGSLTGTIIATSPSVSIINKTDLPVITLFSTEVTEGDNVDVTVAVDDGTYYWTVLNETTTVDDFASTSGSFIVTEGTGTFQVLTVNEFFTESLESFKIQIRINSVSGTVIAVSDSIILSNNLDNNSLMLEFDTAGTYTWTCPQDVDAVFLTLVGGGAGGGGGLTQQTSNSTLYYYGGGGGGGYVVNRRTSSVTPGQVYTVIVGAGGFGGSDGFQSSIFPNSSYSPTRGTPGGSSSFRLGSTILQEALGGPISPSLGSGGGGPFPGETYSAFNGTLLISPAADPVDLLSGGGGSTAPSLAGRGGRGGQPGDGSNGQRGLVRMVWGGTPVTITPSSTSILEGESLTVTVGIEDGTYYWVLINGTSSNADFESTNGTFTSVNGVGVFSVNPIMEDIVLTEGDETFRIQVRTTSITGPIFATSEIITIVNTVDPRYAEFTTAGTYTWTVPEEVTSISAVTVGGGAAGGGGNYNGNAGGGGGLSWKNNIPVMPGEQLIITVGEGGQSLGVSGLDSIILRGSTELLKAGGGGWGSSSGSSRGGLGGTYIDSSYSGGNGGDGGIKFSSGTIVNAGAGGAGGYSGNGGAGASTTGFSGSIASGGSGTGGGGGGGGTAGGTYDRAGGGVGLLGQGPNGAGGQSFTTGYGAGLGGSYGQSGGNKSSGPIDTSSVSSLNGGNYGGGGSYSFNGSIGVGGSGGVRIIWGEGRSFPSNAV